MNPTSANNGGIDPLLQPVSQNEPLIVPKPVKHSVHLFWPYFIVSSGLVIIIVVLFLQYQTKKLAELSSSQVSAQSEKKIEKVASPQVGLLTKIPSTSEVFGVGFKNLPADQLPRGFSSDFPSEKTGEILVNGNRADFPGGSGYSLAYREFYSKKSIQENFDIYKNYFLQNGWEVNPHAGNMGMHGGKGSTVYNIEFSQAEKVKVSIVVYYK